MTKPTRWLDQVRWDAHGLVPVVAQDATDRTVLMFAHMNRAALEATVERGEATYWSRSRQKLWRKGEDSGHIQKVREIRLDCDSDVILLVVEQVGAIACHTGRHSCFFTLLKGTPGHGRQWVTVEPVLKDPKEIYK